MRPRRNKVFCPYSNRTKMLFKTEKEANLFIAYNNEDIKHKTGISIARSYHCEACDGWHITSSECFVQDEVVNRYYYLPNFTISRKSLNEVMTQKRFNEKNKYKFKRKHKLIK